MGNLLHVDDMPEWWTWSLFTMQGTYLLLEKLRYAAYRRLLRKVCGVHAEMEPHKRTQIPLPQFQAALAFQVRLLLGAFGLLI